VNQTRSHVRDHPKVLLPLLVIQRVHPLRAPPPMLSWREPICFRPSPKEYDAHHNRRPRAKSIEAFAAFCRILEAGHAVPDILQPEESFADYVTKLPWEKKLQG
jgi:hypothetical protein